MAIQRKEMYPDIDLQPPAQSARDVTPIFSRASGGAFQQMTLPQDPLKTIAPSFDRTGESYGRRLAADTPNPIRTAVRTGADALRRGVLGVAAGVPAKQSVPGADAIGPAYTRQQPARNFAAERDAQAKHYGGGVVRRTVGKDGVAAYSNMPGAVGDAIVYGATGDIVNLATDDKGAPARGYDFNMPLDTMRQALEKSQQVQADRVAGLNAQVARAERERTMQLTGDIPKTQEEIAAEIESKQSSASKNNAMARQKSLEADATEVANLRTAREQGIQDAQFDPIKALYEEELAKITGRSGTFRSGYDTEMFNSPEEAARVAATIAAAGKGFTGEAIDGPTSRAAEAAIADYVSRSINQDVYTDKSFFDESGKVSPQSVNLNDLLVRENPYTPDWADYLGIGGDGEAYSVGYGYDAGGNPLQPDQPNTFRSGRISTERAKALRDYLSATRGILRRQAAGQ